MLLRLLRGQPLGMIIPQQVVQKVERLLGHEVLVLLRDILMPRLTRMFAQYSVDVMVELDGIPAPVSKNIDQQWQQLQDYGTKMMSGQERYRVE